MLKYTNPQPMQILLPQGEDDGGRAYLEQKLNQVVEEKYDPIFE